MAWHWGNAQWYPVEDTDSHGRKPETSCNRYLGLKPDIFKVETDASVASAIGNRGLQRINRGRRIDRDTTQFPLLLEDDGRGFDPGALVSGAGLTGMKQRAATLGGRLDIISRPGAGTRLRLAVPWP